MESPMEATGNDDFSAHLSTAWVDKGVAVI